MEQYRIDGLITEKTTALTLKPAAGPELQIAVGGPSDAALFEQDRRILDVSRSPAPVTGWRLRQDDVLRAHILDRGYIGSAGSGGGFLNRMRVLVRENLVLAGLDTSPEREDRTRRFDVNTERGVCSVSWPENGWEVTFFAPDNQRIGRVVRVPDGYVLEIEPHADRFLVLGLALFIFLQFYKNALPVREEYTHQTWIVNQLSTEFPPHRRRHPRERRRKWIDDPLGSRKDFPRGRYGIDDPDPNPERKWIDNPIPEPAPVRIDDPKPEPEPVRIDDPKSDGRG